MKISVPDKTLYSKFSPINILLFGAIAWLSVCAILYAEVTPDAGYWLQMPRVMASGWRLYLDIRPSHTSSMLYFLTFVNQILHDPPYCIYIFISILCTIACGIVAFSLLRINGIRKSLSIVISGYLVLSILRSEGIFITSETYAVLLVLLAYRSWFSLELTYAKSFYTGALIGIAFTIRQYALLYMVALFAEILISKRVDLRQKCFKLAIASVVFVVVLGLYFSFLSWGARSDVAVDALGSWYRWYWTSFPKHLENFIYVQPHILALPLLVSRRLLLQSRFYLVVLSTVLLSLSPGLIRQYPHYLILAIPFSSILLGLCLENQPLSSVLRKFIPCSLFLSITGGYFEGAKLIQADMQSRQIETANESHEIFRPGERGLILGNFAWNYLFDLRPVDNFRIAYFFPEIIPREILLEAISRAPLVIIEEDNYGYLQKALYVLKMSKEDLELKLTRDFSSHTPRSNPSIKIWVRKEGQY